MSITLLKPHTTPRLITVPVDARRLERGDVLALEVTKPGWGIVQQPYVVTGVLSNGKLVFVTLDTGEVKVFSASVRLPVVTG